jgi:plastocyanin
MHSTTLFGIFAVVAAASAAVAGCGSDTGTTSTSTTGAGGSDATTTSTMSTTGSSTTTTSTGAAGTGGAGPTLLNGCDMAALEDHTMDVAVEIKFGGAVGIKYEPACIKVKSGTMVTFTGDTGVHPLAGGEVIVGKAATADANSPIKATNAGPPSVTFAIAPAGNYPYFCTEHYSAGMKGLVVAE